MSMVLSRREGAVAILTLNNPGQYNALAAGVLAGLAAALDQAAADLEVGDPPDRRRQGLLLRRAIRRRYVRTRRDDRRDDARFRQPDHREAAFFAEAGRHGGERAGRGRGVGVALAGDLVFAARSARFILSFVRLGAALDGGTSLFLQRSIGAARARALALTGEPLTGEQAAEWGLVWKCVDDAALFDEALAAAKRLAAGAPLAMATIKKQLDDAWTDDLPKSLDAEASAQTRAFVTADLREGAAAFVEKRAPKFTGK